MSLSALESTVNAAFEARTDLVVQTLRSGDDLTTALAAYTSGSARINGLDAVTGSIREGLDADFAVVDADLSEIGDHEICQATVTTTWVRGQIAFQR